ncbi:MAG: sialate O-acetylesterase [Luteolibacter sp.]|jgi:hypothetical protein
MKNTHPNPSLVRRTLRAGFLAFVICCGAPHALAETRTWTSADGARTFDGELLAFDPATGSVTVKRTDGQSLTFNQTILSPEDIEFLAAQGVKEAPPVVSAPTSGGSAPAPSGAVVPAGAGGNGDEPADMSKPVQVFILLGQSNMLGFGKTHGSDAKTLENAVKEQGLYPFLVDADGNWRTRKDVRNVFVMERGGMNIQVNDWLTITNKNIGPEIGIGHHLGSLYKEPVMLLKACIGNRSLGWDLLPPGSEPYEFNGKMEPGYRGTSDNPKGDGSKPAAGWYAGKQYDDDIGNAKTVLEDLKNFYPGAKGYEVAGFFWWQGDKDSRNAAHAEFYEKNLVRFIEQLRVDFNAPNAKFVMATLGQTKKGDGGNGGKLLDAKMAVDGNSGKYPQFKGNVATVYSNPLSKGGSSGGHYSGDARTYMNVGLGMGEAMVELLTGKR